MLCVTLGEKDAFPVTTASWRQSPQSPSEVGVVASMFKLVILLSTFVNLSSAETQYVVCFVAQSCLTLGDSMDCSSPGSSVHGIFKARILEWVTISFSRGSSRPRDRTCVSCVSCTGRRFFTAVPKSGTSSLILVPYMQHKTAILRLF